MPVVLIDREIGEPLFDSVLVENEAGARRIVCAAIARGARRLGMIEGPLNVQTAKEREAGFLLALAESGLEPVGLIPGDYTTESGQRGMRALLDMGVDTVFAANHELNIGALSVEDARVAHVRILGFDGIELSGLYIDRLDSLLQPVEEIGRMAAKLLLARIENPASHAQTIRLPLEYSKGDSL